jgi:Mn-containing catalase
MQFALAEALETLGVNWVAALPIPKTSADDESQAAKLYQGASPSNDGTELSTAIMPEGFPMTIAPERREEFSPGLDKELLALIQATAEVEIATNGAVTK